MPRERIAVTGGYGFIGSALLRLILSDTPCQVLNIDKLTYAANPASVPQGIGNTRYCFAKADIADAAAMREMFRDFKSGPSSEAVIALSGQR
jgi:dTDP-glucose 4,6-dehydratase